MGIMGSSLELTHLKESIQYAYRTDRHECIYTPKERRSQDSVKNSTGISSVISWQDCQQYMLHEEE